MARARRSRVDWARFEREGFRREFARFLARAGLTPAQEDEFLDLVVGEGRLHAEREAKVRSGEIKTLQDLIAFLGPRKAQFEDRLRELLGDDLYREYRTAAMRIPLERSLKIYAAIAARHDAGFSAAQLDLVTDSMLEAYLANGATPLFNPFESMISDSRYFAEIMARKKAFAEVIQQVGPVLSANQRAALQKYQDQQILGWLAHRSGKLPVTMSGGS